jgi:undecaprenyl-diphosphatase
MLMVSSSRRRRIVGNVCGLSGLLLTTALHAQSATAPAAKQQVAPEAPNDVPPQTRKAPEARAESVTPRPALPPPAQVRFVADPVSDAAVLSFALGTAALSELIIGTGEITPQQPNLDAHLLSIDHEAQELTPNKTWKTISNVGLFSAIGFALADPVMSGFRDGTQAGIVDAVIYSETLAITWNLTNLTKIAFRRPRPSAYKEAQRRKDAGLELRVGSTDSALSFFSGHAAITASVASTATYLAFSRSPGTPRPWITLGAGTLVTVLTAYGRVESGDHFPTDVIAGAMAGAGIGVLVPHLHRSDEVKRRPVWIGFLPTHDSAVVTANALL